MTQPVGNFTALRGNLEHQRFGMSGFDFGRAAASSPMTGFDFGRGFALPAPGTDISLVPAT